jgi:hypothetical protein
VNNKQLVVVGSVVAAVLAVIIVLLVTGGPPTEDLAEDAANDVSVSEGPAPPKEHSLADVRSARVYLEASQVVFEAEMATPIPKNLKNQTLTWRWEILEGGSETWIVSANVSVRSPIASVLSTQGNYGASTNDDTLPGGIDWSGNTLYVRLNTPQIENFPGEFTWRLETSLDGDRGNPRSAEASDTAPGSGLGQYPPP